MLLRQGEAAMNAVRTIVEDASSRISGHSHNIPAGVVLERKSVKLAAPILDPQKIITVGLNYRDQCEENKIEPPKFPVTFCEIPINHYWPPRSDRVASGGYTAKCILNGNVVQHSNTRHLIFGVSYLVSFLSKNFTLFPGDSI